MSYFVHVTGQTERDMDEAAAYIAFTLFNPDAAYKLLITANEILTSLQDNPQRIRPIDDPLLSSWGIRFIMVKNYLAFYIIEEDKRMVHIIRFLHAKRNWKHLLKNGFSLD